MTFEEFFNKKRIDLVALKAAEPGLFAEFEKHFTQMGEKSFDHTKKYWFNKLRLQYHLAPEQKPEKMHLENRLAEQTVVETLTESIPTPSVGFKPRFKPGVATKPATETSDIKDPIPKDSATATPEVNEAAATHNQNPPFEQEKAAMQDIVDTTPRTTDEDNATPETSAPKPGFKPRFNMKMTKGEEPQTKEFEKVDEPEKKTSERAPSAETTTPKPGFKPRFNMKMAASKPAETDEENPEDKPAAETPPQAKSAVSKPGFKPRFNMKTMAPNPAEAAEEKTEPERTIVDDKQADIEIAPLAEAPATAPKPGFKPRFNMKTMAPKPAEATEEKSEPKQTVDGDKPADASEQTPPVEISVAPKVGFKPRFNAKTTKPQPPQE